MIPPSLTIRPDDFSLKMLEAYLEKRPLTELLSVREITLLDMQVMDMHQPYIFKFIAIISIRRDREENTNRSFIRTDVDTSCPFPTRSEYYHRRRAEKAEAYERYRGRNPGRYQAALDAEMHTTLMAYTSKGTIIKRNP